MTAPLDEYRRHIVLAEQKAQEDFDKTVVTLSGGALGISFIFLERIVGSDTPRAISLLVGAWACWAFSVTAVLGSYFLSQQALRKTINQLNAHELPGSRPGGVYDVVTAIANAAGGVLFIAGVVFMMFFAVLNLEEQSHESRSKHEEHPATAPTAQPASAQKEGL